MTNQNFPYTFMTSISPDGKEELNEYKLRSWEEDFDGENGRYTNECCVCKKEFIGHKRRVSCKQCCKAKTNYPFEGI